jgi:hypothetical protein
MARCSPWVILFRLGTLTFSGVSIWNGTLQQSGLLPVVVRSLQAEWGSQAIDTLVGWGLLRRLAGANLVGYFLFRLADLSWVTR